jgi:dihydroorotate dehydrogenase (NAD+) catalytic subunit
LSTGTEVNIGSLRMKNPIMPASGTFDWLGSDPPGAWVNNLGAFVAKSITLDPQPGNPPQRVAETPSGMLNAIGIPSVGLDVFVTEVLPKYEAFETAVVVSAQAYSTEEAAAMTARLNQESRVDAIEINLSCPNLKHGSIIAQSVELTAETVSAARSETDLPLIAKLSPNVASIGEIAQAAEDSGADALCLINTVRGMAIDINTRRALLGHVMGGLSGPAIKPIALHLVWECYEAVDIPIVGAGGIVKVEDVIEFLLAGACAVQVGTATFREPRTMERVISGLEGYLTTHKIGAIHELVGLCHKEGATYGK